MTRTRKNITIFFSFTLIAAVIVIIGILLRQHIANTSSVQIFYNPVAGASVSLYKGASKELLDPEIQGDPIPVENGEILHLEKWPYVAIAKGDDIAPIKQIIYPRENLQTVKLSINKTDDVLEAGLKANKDNIEQALVAMYPTLPELYTSEEFKLHGDGSWATVKLAYKGTDKMLRDTLHAVLHQTNGEWKVAAKPAIAIYHSDSLKDAPRSLFWSVMPERIINSEFN